MDRLTELEIKVSWLEKLVSDLDGVLREAIARIDRQQAEIADLREGTAATERDTPGER